MVARRVLQASVILLALGLVAGCASVRHVGRVLDTPEQRAAYRADLAAAQRVCDAKALSPCPFLKIAVYAEDRLPEHVAGVAMKDGTIGLSQGLYADGAERFRRVVLAHEIGHVLLRHAGTPRCQAERAVCEFEADQESVSILHFGWGMTPADASKLVYSKLLLRRDVEVPQGGHPPGCVEIRSFARTWSFAIPAKCLNEQGGRQQ